MTKKQPRKLTLSRETLRSLDRQRLGAVGGGTGDTSSIPCFVGTGCECATANACYPPSACFGTCSCGAPR
jgi:hypothetical protein